MKQRSIAVVMAAGGKGVRMGREKPKQFLLLDGRPLFLYSLETCLFHPKIGRVLLGVPREYLDETRRLIETYVTDPDAKTRVRIYEGGRRRQDTVALGVRLLEGDPKITSVMVHDAARPFLSGAILDRACDILRDGKSFGVGIPVSDTLWKRGDSSGHDLLSGIVEREKIVRAQTPQGSPVPVFLEALDRAGRSGDPDFTDEASLLLWAGTPVVIVPGEENNRKITTPEDLAWAEERILYEKGVSSMNGKNPGSPPRLPDGLGLVKVWTSILSKKEESFGWGVSRSPTRMGFPDIPMPMRSSMPSATRCSEPWGKGISGITFRRPTSGTGAREAFFP